MTKLIDPNFKIENGSHGSLVFEHSQEITDDFRAMLKDIRDSNAAKSRMGELYPAATIPNAVVEKWAREGFDVHTAGIKACLARLRAEGLDEFITTTKRF